MLPITENRIEKLLAASSFFSCHFCLIRWSKTYAFFLGPHCLISAHTQDFELKFSIQTKFDTLISNLKLYFQYIILMTSG